jgi:hypothetical protein
VEKNELNPVAFGYATATVGSLLYLVLWIGTRFFQFGDMMFNVFSGTIISRSASKVWIVPELIQMAILCFVGGYLIARSYNKFA